ncbi:MAG: PhoH family protein [Sphaerochaetaceae bacterium]
MSSTIVFDHLSQMQKVCGINDRNIPYVELLLNGTLYLHGNSITFQDIETKESSSDDLFVELMKRLRLLAQYQENITEAEIFLEYQALQNGSSKIDEATLDTVIRVGSKVVYPKGARQNQFVKMMRKHQIVFSIGPAGTGKTFLAVAHALAEVMGGKKQKVVLTRPVVEAGESLGYLPGDMNQKISPYLRPLYDAMEYIIPPAIIKRLEENGSIETAPLAYMRGRSLNNATIILDEAQNTTIEQMKMFLTRLSENSSAIITGDITQIDLPLKKGSGLIHATSILKEVPEIGFIEFFSQDVVRSRIVQRIIDAYEKESK